MPFIIQSKHPIQVLTDSNTCVQAHSNLLRGEFSATACVRSFLSIGIHYEVSVSHITLYKHRIWLCQSSSHVLSRMKLSALQVRFRNGRVFSIQSVSSGCDRWFNKDILCQQNRLAGYPSKWLFTVSMHAHLLRGTWPSKRMQNCMQRVTIASDGLLVVMNDALFCSPNECIVVSRGELCMAWWPPSTCFSPPSPYQMKQVICWYLYALDIEAAIKTTCCSWRLYNPLKYIQPPLALPPFVP